jgi:hypothetical protein
VPEDFDIGQEFDRLTGVDAGEPVVPETPTTDSAVPTDTGEQPTGEGAAQPAEGQQQDTAGDGFSHWEQIIAGDPALQAKARAMQADYTRKTQELAAHQQQVQGFLALQRLTQEDPAQAAALLSQYAAQLQGGQAGQKPETADPYAGLEAASPVEELALKELRELRAFRQQWEQAQQTQQQREENARFDAEVAEVERLAGRSLSEEEKGGLYGFCCSRKIGNIVDGYRLMNYDAEMQRAAQAARNEASTIVSQKALAPGAPSTLTPRAPGNPVKEWKSDREMISDLFDQMVQAG